MKKNQFSLRLLLSYVLPLLLIFFVFTFFNPAASPTQKMTHGDLVQELEKDRVESMVYRGEVLEGVMRDTKQTFEVIIPADYFPEFYKAHLKNTVESGKVSLVFEEKPGENFLLKMLPDFLFLIVIIALFSIMYKRMQGQSSGVNTFGKSKARLNREDTKRIRFADVAGLKEEKEELTEIVDFLKNPGKFTNLGARIPKGVLLMGPPGTGKTYLSKAVAGEAGVPFFSISGSDFVEMFVGVGASRVRDLFREGKKNAPCIIFIDEIDAVGRRRGAGLGGGNDEREQTLNQLLVEMDGFDQNEGIIIMAATNRPDILDPAILRPGRFDRQVMIGMPNMQEREEILEVHLRNKKIAEDVNLNAVARQTAGFTPADLENMCNEAALLTARSDQSTIDMKTFEEAAIKVQAGPEKKSRKVIEHERKITAYHEAGHAIVTRALPGMDQVNMITIVPRGRAGGFTSFLPEDDRSYMSRNEMRGELVSFLGGRAAEALVLDDISTGASNDIERATHIARSMVVKYGMTDSLGPVAYDEGSENVFLGNDLGRMRAYSEQTAQQIDAEIHRLMTQAFERATDILTKNRTMLETLAQRLLDVETVRSEEFEAMFQQYGMEEGSLA